MYLLGYDIGTSSIKVALTNIDTGKTIGTDQSPIVEMNITASQIGWAEQDPEVWWDNLCQATKMLVTKYGIDTKLIQGIGIAYQMHGLVMVDASGAVLRPAIIWCDSRAVSIGQTAFEEIGKEKCLSQFLNSPGNFTASKLKWVKEHEPEIYKKIDKIMLPGDYIAMRLTGEINTTISGLSEGIFWDFTTNDLAYPILDYFGLDKSHIPEIVPTFSIQGKVNSTAATETGLKVGTPITYRAGDQPNNALSLNVLKPGEIAATGGTSGVVYGVVDTLKYDPYSRVNSFAHVNYAPTDPRIGVLLCINGAGSQYRFIKQQMAAEQASYLDLERQLVEVPIGSDGLRTLPFGNGAERMLQNKNLGGQINNVQFNRHARAHFYRSALEGIAFSFVYGIRILNDLGLNQTVIRVGNDNLFQSKTFAETIAHSLNIDIEVMKTNGAIGAAKAAGVATQIFGSINEAFNQIEVVKRYEPNQDIGAYEQAYQLWEQDLHKFIN